MPDLSGFSENTWVNGGPPSIQAGTLNTRETYMGAAFEELRRSQAANWHQYSHYFAQRSNRRIDEMEDQSEWSSAGTVSLSDDTTNSRVGKSGVRMTETDTSGGWMSAYKTISSIDLTYFADGRTATGSDPIMGVLFYISDASKVTYVSVKYGDDNSHNYSATYSSGFDNGFNVLYPDRTSFTTNGTPSGWDDITYIRLEWYSTSSASGAYVMFDALFMTRKDAGYSYFNPWVLDDGNSNWDYEVLEPSTWIAMVYDSRFGKYGLMKGEGTWQFGVHVYCTIQDYIAHTEHYVVVEDEISNFRWSIDTSNCLEVYVTGGTLYIKETLLGTPSTAASVALPTTLSKGIKVLMMIEQDSTAGIIRVMMSYDREVLVLEYEHSFTDAGCIYLQGSQNDTNFSLMTDYKFSNSKMNTLDMWNRPRILKNETVLSNNTTTPVNLEDCKVFLPPNGLFHIELHLIYNCASTTPEIKGEFIAAGDIELVGGINAQGMSNIATTAAQAEESKHSSYDLFTDDIIFGTETGPCYANERFLVQTGNTGGYFYYRYWQHTSTPASPVYVRKETYIKVEKVSR
jgi:hypothetical protein